MMTSRSLSCSFHRPLKLPTLPVYGPTPTSGRLVPRPGHDLVSSRVGFHSSGGRRYAHATAPLRKLFKRPPPKRRLVQSCAAAGLLYLAYSVSKDFAPADQQRADPSKKSLVVLGTGWGSISLLKDLDTENYNVTVVSPRNYFLFTPLLPSCTTGLVEHRSIMEPIRTFLRRKRATVTFYEAEATEIDHEKQTIRIQDTSEIKGSSSETELPYDMLVVGVGAESATFGVPGVQEHGCFLKEVDDARRIRNRIMDCVETANFKNQAAEEAARLMHVVVVGGGPTGVEFAGELQDFFERDLKKWIPEIADKFQITLIEALPSVLPMFSKTLIEYTEKTLGEETVKVRTKTTVRSVSATHVTAQTTDSEGIEAVEEIPYGLLVWATGNTARPLTRKLMNQIPEQENARRGLEVDEHLLVKGTKNVWAVGDCAVTNYAPTAQVAAQEGAFLARSLNRMAKAREIEEQLNVLSEEHARQTGPDGDHLLGQIRDQQKLLSRVKHTDPFDYSHQGSLAYIGSEKAVADISWLTGNFASGGRLTYLFWRSAYLNMCFSTRNRVLVCLDWIKSFVFGRDVSRE